MSENIVLEFWHVLLGLGALATAVVAIIRAIRLLKQPFNEAQELIEANQRKIIRIEECYDHMQKNISDHMQKDISDLTDELVGLRQCIDEYKKETIGKLHEMKVEMLKNNGTINERLAKLERHGCDPVK